MSLIRQVLAGVVCLSSVAVEAAVKPFYHQNKITVIQDGVSRCDVENRRYDFRVEVISDDEGLKYETFKKGMPFVMARPEERYAIRVHNPLPVRAAVNLTVDGLNTITGKPSGISDGSKWMIDPYSYVTIRGWQVNDGEARRFFFTEKPRSYAAWRGEALNKDLSVNCGVIGAAYFWNKEELQNYFDSNPTVVYTPKPIPLSGGVGASKSPFAAADSMREQELKSADKKERAGTGMGERESHPTRYVNFQYNAGMYKAAQAVLVYYDFEKIPTPNPFPGLSYAPEMD